MSLSLPTRVATDSSKLMPKFLIVNSLMPIEETYNLRIVWAKYSIKGQYMPSMVVLHRVGKGWEL